MGCVALVRHYLVPTSLWPIDLLVELLLTIVLFILIEMLN